MQSITLESNVCAVPELVVSKVAGEVVIMHLEKGIYYGLDAIGSRVWNLIQEETTVAKVRDQLLAEYDVEPEQCVSEVLALLKDLHREGLLRVERPPA